MAFRVTARKNDGSKATFKADEMKEDSTDPKFFYFKRDGERVTRVAKEDVLKVAEQDDGMGFGLDF